MFTGIVEELGTVEVFVDGRLQLGSPVVLGDAVVGASIAVNGCCLTVVEIVGDTWWADVSDETLLRTTLGSLQPGSKVNLERPMALGERLGGHIVQGHVDGIGVVVSRAPDLRVSLPARLARYVVEKGSITVDGVSLTVTDVVDAAGAVPGGEAEFGVAVIPHTAEATTLGARQPGDAVNLEVDVLAKYVERLLRPGLNGPATNESGRPA